MLSFRKSAAGLIVAGVYLGLALAALATHRYSLYTNAGDSGESAVLMVPFMWPWLKWIPLPDAQGAGGDWMPYLWFGVSVLVNAFLLYCLFGGLRSRHKG